MIFNRSEAQLPSLQKGLIKTLPQQGTMQIKSGNTSQALGTHTAWRVPRTPHILAIVPEVSAGVRFSVISVCSSEQPIFQDSNCPGERLAEGGGRGGEKLSKPRSVSGQRRQTAWREVLTGWQRNKWRLDSGVSRSRGGS